MTDPQHSDIWQVWFDGCALPNPGKIGIGILIQSPDGQRSEQAIATGLHGCNNQAELRAMILALQLATHQGARHVMVRGDSDVAIRCVQGKLSTRIPTLLPLIALARQALAAFSHAELQWVPRHRNLDADRLSRQAMGLPPKPAPHPSRKRH